MSKMKTLIPMAVIMIMLSSSNVFASGIDLSNIKNKTVSVAVANGLNVRKTPKVDKTNSIFTASKGTKFEVVGQQSGWLKVKIGTNKYGWINASYVNLNNALSKEEIDNIKRENVVKLAYEQLGKPYIWGATGPKSFDCSGLTSYVYKNGGEIKIPRTAKEQSKFGTTVKKTSLKPGDLLFSSTDGSGNVTHVGIYVGNGEMIHSPKPGDVVRKTTINNSYWNRTYLLAKRVI